MTDVHFGFTATFERDFNHVISSQYMNKIWKSSFGFSAMYVILVLVGKYVMQNRQRYDLRFPLIGWSAGLAIFSIIGTIRTLPELYSILTREGLKSSVCEQELFRGVSGFWAFCFTLSKLVELGDTVFIILRKQPLQFLHCYHHATVLVYSWYTYSNLSAQSQWFIAMNYFVHSVMYSYYVLRASRVPVSPSVGIAITSIQLLQMIVGCGVNIVAYQIKQREGCQPTYANIFFSIFMYASYFILFANFFFHRYVKPQPKSDKKEH